MRIAREAKKRTILSFVKKTEEDLEDARRSSADNYANIDELVANADEARDRLKIAARTVGLYIAQQLTQ